MAARQQDTAFDDRRGQVRRFNHDPTAWRGPPDDRNPILTQTLFTTLGTIAQAVWSGTEPAPVPVTPDTAEVPEGPAMEEIPAT